MNRDTLFVRSFSVYGCARTIKYIMMQCPQAWVCSTDIANVSVEIWNSLSLMECVWYEW